MSRLFWPLFAVSTVFSVLVFAALPFGPDLVYVLLAGSQLGMLAVLGRACSRQAGGNGPIVFSSRPRYGVPTEGSPPYPPPPSGR